MHTVTIFPLGNADTQRIDLENGKKLLIDYADMRNPDDPNDKRIDLPRALRRDLEAAGRNAYDVVTFTHLDDDHIHGSSAFFYFEHAARYQGADRIRIDELWVPAAAILEEGSDGDARVIRQEARHRLKEGRGIRVFSSPGLLDDWLRDQGITPARRRHLITDAGTTVPGFTLHADGVEFFVHSPFATRSDDGALLDRNSDAIALQATFYAGGRHTRMHLFSDLTYEVIDDIVRVTEHHARSNPARAQRLRWDVFKLPHHSSYRSLGPDKGTRVTEPVPRVRRLYEGYGQPGAILVSTSKPILPDTDDQPPHRQAAAYYASVADQHGGQYIVTMEHPSREAPAPLVITIGGGGTTVRKCMTGGVGPVVTTPAPRAGTTLNT